MEIVVDAGTDVSNIFVTIYSADGTVRSVNALLTPAATAGGRDIYVLDTAISATFAGLHQHGAVALEVDGTVTQFVSFDDGSPVTATEGAAAGLTSTQIGQAGAGDSLESTDGAAATPSRPTPARAPSPAFAPEPRSAPPMVNCP